MSKAPVMTKAELGLVKEYIILPILLDVLEWDISLMKPMPLRMLLIYVRTLRHVQDQITADLVTLRKGMRESGIKVYKQQRTDKSIESQYVCRGYHHTQSMLWGIVKAEVEQRLSAYLQIDLTASEVVL